MKKVFSLIVLVMLINTTSSCESDDICDPDTPTTPRLSITFYDDKFALKPVTNLRVQGVGMEDALPLFNGVSTIQVPLNISENSAKYGFTLNYDANNPDNPNTFTDTLEFNYTRQTLYVSRACGYKMNFTLNPNDSIPRPVILNNNPDVLVDGNWMKLIQVIDYNVINENETQINIYYKY